MISGVSNNVMALRDSHERIGKAAHEIANSNPQNVDGGEEVKPVEASGSANEGVNTGRDDPAGFGPGETDPTQASEDRKDAAEKHASSREERGLAPDEAIKGGLTIDPADGVARPTADEAPNPTTGDEGGISAAAIAELVEAKMDHGANIAVLRTQDKMLGTLLDAFG